MKGLFAIALVVACVALFTPMHDVLVSFAAGASLVAGSALAAEMIVDVAVLAIVVLALLLEPVRPVESMGSTDIRESKHEPQQPRAPPHAVPAFGIA